MVKFLKRNVMYSVVICNDDRDCTGRSKNQNRKYSQQTSCDHSSTKSKSKTDKSICSGSAVKCNECLHAV